jgi:hypothetical protein
MGKLLGGVSKAFAPVLPACTRTAGLNFEVDVVSNAAVEAVYICTPDATHGALAIACLNAGKHVLVEKPVYAFSDVAARDVLFWICFRIIILSILVSSFRLLLRSVS